MLPIGNDILNAQKTIRHNGNKIKVSQSIDDSEVDSHADTGEYGNNQGYY